MTSASLIGYNARGMAGDVESADTMIWVRPELVSSDQTYMHAVSLCRNTHIDSRNYRVVEFRAELGRRPRFLSGSILDRHFSTIGRETPFFLAHSRSPRTPDFVVCRGG